MTTRRISVPRSAVLLILHGVSVRSAATGANTSVVDVAYPIAVKPVK